MKTFALLKTAFLLVIFFLTTGCRPGSLTIREAWARPGIAGGNSAAYFVIDNPGSQADILLGASSDIAQATELHATVMSGGMMSMEHQENVPVPARGKVEFKAGGLHVMFINLLKDLKPGDQFTLRLKFQNAGEITLTVPVKEP